MLIMNIVLGIDDLHPKLDSGKFCLNTEICSDFYEIWRSQQIEHANYEYNSGQFLERQHDYWLKMVIGSE